MQPQACKESPAKRETDDGQAALTAKAPEQASSASPVTIYHNACLKTQSDRLLVPVNHLVTVRRDLAERHPDLIAELLRMFKDAKAMAPALGSGRDPLPIGRMALEPAIELALRYAAEQGLLPGQLNPDEVWEGLPADMM